MTVETATHIDDLNDAYPAGADVKSEGDDHLRLLKTVLLASFSGSSWPRALSTWADKNSAAVAKTGVDSVVATDDGKLFTGDATTAPFQLTIPDPTGVSGMVVFFKKIDAGANAVTIAPSSGTIDGAAAQALSSQHAFIGLWSDGVAWRIIAQTGGAGGGGASDHGALTGLTDDDHGTGANAYHTDARGDARYYTKTLLDAGQLDGRYYTEAEVDATFAALGSAAAEDAGTAVDDLVQLEDVGGGTPGLPAVDGSQLTGLPSGVSDHGALTGLDDNDHGAIYYTETEVDAMFAALGTAAALDVGTAVDDVVQLEDVGGGTPGLPAIDGSQLTGLSGGSGGLTVLADHATTGALTLTTNSIITATAVPTSTALPSIAGASHRIKLINKAGGSITVARNGTDTIDTGTSIDAPDGSEIEFVVKSGSTDWHAQLFDAAGEANTIVSSGSGTSLVAPTPKSGTALQVRGVASPGSTITVSHDDPNSNVDLDVADTAVTPGSYTSADITVDQQGRITAASNGGGGASTDARTNVPAVDANASRTMNIASDLGTKQECFIRMSHASAQFDVVKNIAAVGQRFFVQWTNATPSQATPFTNSGGGCSFVPSSPPAIDTQYQTLALVCADDTTDANVFHVLPASLSVSGSIAVEDEGSEVVGTATAINFVGSGVTATDGGGGTATVTIAAGSAPIDTVFGRTGTVVATQDDYAHDQLSGLGDDDHTQYHTDARGDARYYTQTAADAAFQVILSEGAFANGDKTKLDGIETSADVTDTANVTSSGALMDSEVTNLAQVKAFDTADYATAAQGTLADSALQPADIASGTITARADAIDFSGGSDGDVLMVQADGSFAVETPAGGGSGLTILATHTGSGGLTLTANAAQASSGTPASVTMPASGSDAEIRFVNNTGSAQSVARAGSDTINGNTTISVPDDSALLAHIDSAETDWKAVVVDATGEDNTWTNAGTGTSIIDSTPKVGTVLQARGIASPGGTITVSHDDPNSNVDLAVASVPEAAVTAHEAAIDHDALTNFVAAEHIDWTADAGASNINVANIIAVPESTVTAHEAALSITKSQISDFGNWKVFYSNGSGALTELTLGGTGTYLKSNGATSAPTFDTPGGSGDVTSAANIADNRVVRGDGGAKGVQESPVSISDHTQVLTVDVTALTTGRTLTLPDADVDLGAFLTAETNDLTATVTWANVPIANIPTGTSGSTVALGDHNHSGVYEPADATIIKEADVDDTPVDAATTAPISSNWAYDHVAAADPHTGYRLESVDINLAADVTGTLPVANGGTGITSFGTGVATFLGTPSSANLAAAVTGETGTGALVFGTNPTLAGATLSGTVDGGGQELGRYKARVVTSVTGSLTTATHSGNVLVTTGNITIPNASGDVGFNAVIVAGGAHTVTFNSTTSAAMAAGDVMTVFVQSTTVIRAVLTAVADQVSFT